MMKTVNGSMTTTTRKENKKKKKRRQTSIKDGDKEREKAPCSMAINN